VTIVLKSGSLSLLEPSGPVQGSNGTALPLRFQLLTEAKLRLYENGVEAKYRQQTQYSDGTHKTSLVWITKENQTQVYAEIQHQIHPGFKKKNYIQKVLQKASILNKIISPLTAISI
jgi:hypothetical protein